MKFIAERFPLSSNQFSLRANKKYSNGLLVVKNPSADFGESIVNNGAVEWATRDVIY